MRRPTSFVGQEGWHRVDNELEELREHRRHLLQFDIPPPHISLPRSSWHDVPLEDVLPRRSSGEVHHDSQS